MFYNWIQTPNTAGGTMGQEIKEVNQNNDSHQVLKMRKIKNRSLKILLH